MTINEYCREAAELATAKGFENGRSVGDAIVLMHAELSEAIEEYRNGNMDKGVYFGEGGKPEGVGIELADCCLRIFNFCGHYGIDLQACIDMKHMYNKTRPFKHGGKLI